ncbi:membrane associated rhomboid family serine protease [Kineococcus xinjiangensis]|uniref:Membrane associated rhomboid family serine protease n=1 Tax=Kineococcus xinjiangensis TaxID=512762 RepID=A0A2S6II58_9ACTN|nr:rhomboid family intramembrane serine protease [Kineococcus xinjiangensis]PPK93903.1 membrane associated rhomboid family serine protease [Kineococcus xinjiangensis]
MSVPQSGPVPAAAPVCPRHPERESYVRCQRCERPVCPQCQREAAVGVQCVDCVAEGNRTVRSARTALGGGLGGAPGAVTKTIIAVCVLMYVAQFVVPLELYAYLRLYNFPAFAPYAFAAGNWWQPLTSAFLHASTLHLLFNMYVLYVTGPYLESLLGRARFIALYLLSALGGAVGATLLPLTAGTAVVGASGAVFGLFAATLVVSRRLGRQVGPVAVLIAINVAFGFLFPAISWQGHLGGLVAGGVVAAVLAYAPRRRRSLVQWGGVAVIGAVLVALLVHAAARMGAFAPFVG